MPDPPRQARVVSVETLHKPNLYSPAQVRRAWDIGYALHRGKLILCEEPDEH